MVYPPDISSPHGNFLHFDNLLYDMASGGGDFGYGVIYTVNIDSDSLRIVHHFDSINGSQPLGTLLFIDRGSIHIASAEVPEISFNPNPCTNSLTIKVSRSSDFIIYDIQGREVVDGFLSEGLNRILFDLHPGVYLLKVKNFPEGNAKRFVVVPE